MSVGAADPRPRVRALRAVRVRIPFRRPFTTATGVWLGREAWIIRLVDADGRTGVGEAVLEPASSDGLAELVERQLTALVRETAERAVTGDLPTADELVAHGLPGRALRAALDTALLDLSARGPDPRLLPAGAGIPVNGTIGFAGPSAGAEAARQAVAAGYTTLKLKAGAERESDVLVERLRAIRVAVGPEVRLRIDVNGAWDPPTAEERLDAIARFGIEYVEQPLPAHEIEASAELRRRVRIPIALDESAESPGAVRAILAAEAADILVVKPARVGGPVAVAEIAERAAERGIPVVLSTLFETGVGIAAGLAAAAALPDPDRHAHGLATAGLLEHDLLTAGLPIDEGRMRLADGLDDEEDDGGVAGSRGGLGIALDERALERFATEAAEAAGADGTAGAGEAMTGEGDR